LGQPATASAFRVTKLLKHQHHYHQQQQQQQQQFRQLEILTIK